MTRVERATLWAGGAVGLALLALVHRYDPATVTFLPQCPSYALFGLLCPGCGATRAVHHLLHLDAPGAFRMNPLLVLALPLLAWWAWATWAHAARGRPLPRSLTSPAAGRATLAILVAYTVLRNLPWYPFTLLAPQ